MKNQYLVRPRDYHIYDLDKSNNRYRSWTTRSATYSDGTRPSAQSSYTYKFLTEGYGFFPIQEEELEFYEKKNNEHHEFISWQNRSDGHGGVKGGSYEDYLKRSVLKLETRKKPSVLKLETRKKK